MDYKTAKQQATDEDANIRLNVATNEKTPPEILFFLANDKDKDVRLAVALNPSTPAHAAQILAHDLDSEIRTSVAMKIARLFAHLKEDQRHQLYQSTVKILETLVIDQITAVRAALSSALADFAGTPPHIARQLAQDVEQQVAEPILRFCAVLSDQDLLEIIGQHPWPWVLKSIAARDSVSETISTAIVDTKDIPATEILLNNVYAKINQLTLEKIKDSGGDILSLKKALAARHTKLPKSFSDRIAAFVGRATRRMLDETSDMDHQTMDDVDEAVKRRLLHKSDSATPQEAAKRAQDMHKKNALHEKDIGDAIAMHDDEFIYAAFVCLSRAPLGVVKKIFASQSAKAVVSLCWKAGLTPRFALQMQKSHLGRIQPKQLLYPREGEFYPLSNDEMAWSLEFFGI